MHLLLPKARIVFCLRNTPSAFHRNQSKDHNYLVFFRKSNEDCAREPSAPCQDLFGDEQGVVQTRSYGIQIPNTLERPSVQKPFPLRHLISAEIRLGSTHNIEIDVGRRIKQYRTVLQLKFE
jgi:hypothetical protein